MRIGLFGGTFDPVHCGHLAVVDKVQVACGLERVWLIPAARSPLRDAPQASAGHRLAMCRLATADDSHLDVYATELERPAPSFTADTLRELTACHPNDVFTLLLGVDTLAEMPAWRDTGTILELSDIAAIARPGYANQLPEALVAKHPGAAKRVKVLGVPASDVSASDVRARLAAKESIEGLVPSTVAAYIQRHGLYGATKGP